MSIIKERILNTGNDMNLKITLGSHDSFTGYQQEIDNLTQFTSNRAINPPVDAEVLRFKMTPTIPITTLLFNFYLATAFPQYKTSYTHAGFITVDDQKGTAKYNSFYIMDFYDTYDPDIQRKIFSTYFTKLGTSSVSNHTISSNLNQLYYWNIPKYYVDEHTGTTFIGYIRFMFINAILGETTLFYNDIPTLSIQTAEKMYFKVELDKINGSWKILNFSNGIVVLKELVGSTEYIDRINDTYPKEPNIQQTYPDGNVFNYTDGKYDEI